ncbi:MULTISPECIES: ATP/GTP-binding protein [Streptomyces]|uniref:ATP/GTP-binding protein n=1 Tax=Streptomyces flaveolus TaxID=67297 RepID=A0ABV3A7A0_9ACTN|nr:MULTISPECIES: ATP/GTP-binding protein [Streptomyces]
MAERTLRSRVAAGWSRAEGTVSKIVLLAVFGLNLVAQFVRPVGDALQDNVYIGGALLSLVGFLLYSEVQRLNTAHETQREATEDLRDGIRVLSERIVELGSAQRSASGVDITREQLLAEIERELEGKDKVELYVMGFTGENTAFRIKKALERLPASTQREVTVRYLVPDFDKEIQLPGRVLDGKAADAPAFRAALKGKIVASQEHLRDAEISMRHDGLGKLDFAFRVLHMSPMLNLYLINADRLVEAVYTPRKNADRQNRTAASREVLDLVMDDRRLLTRWHSDDGQRAAETVRDRRVLFNTLWTLAHPLKVPAPAPADPVPAPADPVPAPADPLPAPRTGD